MIKLNMKKVIILDYDNTIAEPKSPPSDEMIFLLKNILESKKVAILTAGRSIKGLRDLLILTAGRSIKGLRDLLISNTKLNNPDLLKNLLLCPKYGNLIFEYEDGWFVLYESTNISQREKRIIERAVRRVKWKSYVPKSNSKQRVHDKGSVISINCLGNDSTDLEKDNWDRDGNIRKKIKEELLKRLGKKYEIFITGRNTIDIVPKEMNKADNILRLLELISESKENAVYIGDEFNPDGNDYPILSTGIKIHHVKSPIETKVVLEEYI